MTKLRVLALPGPGTGSGNPYIPLLYAAMAETGCACIEEFVLSRLIGRRRSEPTIWHVHWPETIPNIPAFGTMSLHMAGFLIAVAAARLRGVAIIWTVHNLQAHDSRRPALERWLMRRFTKRVDGTIALSAHSLAAAHSTYPELRSRPAAVIPHGLYTTAYPSDIEPGAARRTLGVTPESKVILYFGRVRAYKNVPKLIGAFRDLDDASAVLIIAGAPDCDVTASEIVRLSDGDPRIRLHLEWVAESDIQLFMKAADLVVLPFRDISNSGSALLALTFGVRLLLPDVPALRHLEDVEGAHVTYFEADLTAASLARALGSGVGAAPAAPASGRPVPEWSEIGSTTCQFFQDVVRGMSRGHGRHGGVEL